MWPAKHMWAHKSSWSAFYTACSSLLPLAFRHGCYWEKRPSKAKFMSGFWSLQFTIPTLSTLTHWDIWFPVLKGLSGKAIWNEKQCCMFCAVHCCAPNVNGCQRKSSCLSSLLSAFSRAFCSVMLLPAVSLCHLPVLPHGSVYVCPSPVQCATWRSLSPSFNCSHPLNYPSCHC